MEGKFIAHSNTGGQFLITTTGDSEFDIMHANKSRGQYEREAMAAISTRADYAKKRQENADRIKADAAAKNAQVEKQKKDTNYNKVRFTGTLRTLLKEFENYGPSDSAAAKMTDKTQIEVVLKVDGKNVASWERNLDGTRF